MRSSEALKPCRHAPVCEVRNIAYSTFTILQVFDDGSAYLAEYDNPPAIIGQGGNIIDVPRQTKGPLRQKDKRGTL